MNVLLSVKNGMSLCVCNGSEYPITKITNDFVIISCATKRTADNIALKVGGKKREGVAEFAYEVLVPFDRFDKIIESRDWHEIVTKYLVSQ